MSNPACMYITVHSSTSVGLGPKSKHYAHLQLQSRVMRCVVTNDGVDADAFSHVKGNPAPSLLSNENMGGRKAARLSAANNGSAGRRLASEPEPRNVYNTCPPLPSFLPAMSPKRTQNMPMPGNAVRGSAARGVNTTRGCTMPTLLSLLVWETAAMPAMVSL